jgi:ABC-type nitrate/sulfonate/bicarbonate transport system substrate-binding protein
VGLARASWLFLRHAVFASVVETIQTGMIGAANAAGWPWYIGIAKGWFADAGITLDIVYVPPSCAA